MATRALRSAIKSSPEVLQAALRRAKSTFSGIKSLSKRVGRGAIDEAAAATRADPSKMAKSTDDAVDTERALAEVTSHPLGDINGIPKKTTKGDPPPGKDPTTNMPNGPAKVQSRWEQVSPYLKGGAGTTILAGVAVGTYMAVSGVYLQNTDGVEVKITKIEKVKNTQNQYKFTYQTQGGQKCGTPSIDCIQSAFNPCKDDTFTFRSTHTTPTLDDITALVLDIDEDAVYFELDLTSIGTGTPEWGFMTCHSSFKNQFRGSVRGTVQLIADVATDVATPVVEGFCDAIPIPFICPDSINMANWTLWLIILCCLLCSLVIAFLLLS